MKFQESFNILKTLEHHHLNLYLLSVSGMYWGQRKLMFPWLFLQGFLASILASLACYYLALFPLKTSCIRGGIEASKDANFRPLLTATAAISSANTRVKEEELSAANSNSSCQPLLWYSVIMILSLLILVYYFYIVQVRMILENNVMLLGQLSILKFHRIVKSS